MLLKTGKLLRNIVVNNKKVAFNNSIKRFSHHDDQGGVPGGNTPCRYSVGNPQRMTTIFLLFFGTGFWAPCFLFIYGFPHLATLMFILWCYLGRSF